MTPTLNTPYVKVYKDGELTNPIKGGYYNQGANRKQRRESMQKSNRVKK